MKYKGEFSACNVFAIEIDSIVIFGLASDTALYNIPFGFKIFSIIELHQ